LAFIVSHHALSADGDTPLSLNQQLISPCRAPFQRRQHQYLDQNKIALRTAIMIQSPSSMNQRTQDEQGHRSQAAAAPCPMAEFLSAAGWV
jgi:hypothetical protein